MKEKHSLKQKVLSQCKLDLQTFLNDGASIFFKKFIKGKKLYLEREKRKRFLGKFLSPVQDFQKDGKV